MARQELDKFGTEGMALVKRPVRFLLLGAEPWPLPAAPGIEYVAAPADGFDAVALVGAVTANELGQALHDGRALFAPIVDFAGNTRVRVDLAATSVALIEAAQTFAGMMPRIRELPDLTDHADSDGLYYLGLAYSRRCDIAAHWAPEVQQVVYYPVLGPVPGARTVLEGLAEFGFLSRRFFGRTNLCSQCRSARLNAEEVCPSCKSGHLRQDSIIHHYACGHQGPESRFVKGHDLICPKCGKELRHFGVDYDKPANVVVCEECGTASSEPEAVFVCLDCAAATPGDGIAVIDWFDYELTSDGIAALRAGRLPKVELAELLRPFPRAMSRRDFLLLATQILHVAIRYDREMTLTKFAVANSASLQAEFGAVRMHEAIKHLSTLSSKLCAMPIS